MPLRVPAPKWGTKRQKTHICMGTENIVGFIRLSVCLFLQAQLVEGFGLFWFYCYEEFYITEAQR